MVSLSASCERCTACQSYERKCQLYYARFCAVRLLPLPHLRGVVLLAAERDCHCRWIHLPVSGYTVEGREHQRGLQPGRVDSHV